MIMESQEAVALKDSTENQTAIDKWIEDGCKQGMEGHHVFRNEYMGKLVDLKDRVPVRKFTRGKWPDKYIHTVGITPAAAQIYGDDIGRKLQNEIPLRYLYIYLDRFPKEHRTPDLNTRLSNFAIKFNTFLVEVQSEGVETVGQVRDISDYSVVFPQRVKTLYQAEEFLRAVFPT